MIKQQKNRIWELDMLRGFAILMVCFDHLCCNFVFTFSSWATSAVPVLESLYEFGYNYLYGSLRAFWRPAFLFLFFCTSGLCTAFSRNNLLRGLKLLFVALLISLVTYYIDVIFDAQTFVLLGVIHCLSLVIIIYSLIELLFSGAFYLVSLISKKPVSKKVFKYSLSFFCLALCVGMFFINKHFNVGLVDATSHFISVSTNSKILGLFFFVENWWTNDYFPLFPFIIFFFFGAALSPILYPNKHSLLPSLDTIWHKPLSLPGKYSLSFYIGGQLVAILFCGLFSLILSGSFL